LDPAHRAAAFLDRDGTIIEDRHYLADPDGVVLLPGAAQAIRRLNAAGIAVIVVTNQSGIGRGYITEMQYRGVAERMDLLLREAGARIDASYHCPHRPDVPACDCRKPGTALFLRAASDHRLDLPSSHFVGDRLRDVLPGLALGGTGYLIHPDRAAENQELPDRVRCVESLEDAVEQVLRACRFD
jgi:D-glycero-D-manno-heptose 1,7-bisphosphate phosphatase